MKQKEKAALLGILLCLSLAASGFEPSASIKVTPLLKTTTSWDGKPLRYPQGQAEITAMILEIAPGAETGWHTHPVPSFGMILEGALEVTLKDGQVKRMNAGESVAEVVDTLHNGRNVGKTSLRLVVFYAGTVGQKLTIKESETR